MVGCAGTADAQAVSRRAAVRMSGSVRYDRIPIGIRKIVELDCPQDYMQFVPEGLEKNFTSADFANAAHIDRQTAASVLAMLNYMEQVKRVGKTGNAYIYDIEEHY